MIADVALPIPVNKLFSYAVPDELLSLVAPGVRVSVPFGIRQATGVVTEVRAGDTAGLKDVDGALDLFPLVDEGLLTMARWASSFYLSPPGMVLKYVLPSLKDLERYLHVTARDAAFGDVDGLKLGKAVRKVGRTRILKLINEMKLGVWDGLTREEFGHPSTQNPRDAAERLLVIDAVEKRYECYEEHISRTLKDGGNVLFLLPDYFAAGAWFAKRMKETYGPRVLWYASGVPVKQRMETYFRARRKGGYIVLGNKNSIFLPVCDLSLIIAERFDDDEYRNEEGFKFNAVGMAVQRSLLGEVPMIMGSAAPSIDLMHRAEKEGFVIDVRQWLKEDYGRKVVNAGSRSPGEMLDRLSAEAAGSLSQGTRTAIYIPRKDYGAYLKCHSCRETFRCSACDGPLHYDREKGDVYCQDCLQRTPYEGVCPHCGSRTIGFSRMGAGFIEEHLDRVLPGSGLILVTGDSLKSSISTVGRIKTGQPAILVGTQSLSKLYGFHVDRLILAGWEELRKMGGYRSEEKTQQVMAHLIDALTPGEIVCDTGRTKGGGIEEYLDITGFYEKELEKRRAADFPPCARVYLVQVRAKTKAGADRALARIRKVIAERHLEDHLFGVLPHDRPPVHERRVIFKGREGLLADAFKDLYDIAGVEIETDPLNF